MSQQLTSAALYKEPSEEEVQAESAKIPRARNGLFAAKVIVSLVFWGAIFGGSVFVACRAVVAANRPASYSGHGGHPALNMLSFCMNLVDFNWDRRVEKEIEKNQPPPLPRPDIPDIPVSQDPLAGVNLESFEAIQSGDFR